MKKLIIIFLSIWCPLCLSCSDGFVKLEIAHQSADVIFTGIAIEAKLIPHENSLYQKAGPVEVTFLVKEIFKGKTKYNHIKIYTGMGGPDCGFEVSLLQQYVVAADRNGKDFYWTGISNGTQPWNSSIDKFLRSKYQPKTCEIKSFRRAICKQPQQITP